MSEQPPRAAVPPLRPYRFPDALQQLASCDFECEAGSLQNNVAWQWLAALAKVCPAFLPGQGVWFEIEAEAAGKKLRQWAFFYIVGCAMSSDTERRLWTYSLSYDPPGRWHYGTTHFTGVAESRLFLDKPGQSAVATEWVAA